MDQLHSLLLLFFLFQIKHMLADFFLQTERMLCGRGVYFHVGRAQHALVHALGSLIVLLIMGTGLPMIWFLIVVEWVVHFHIDWWKAQHTETHDLNPDQAAFWRATGIDQALHQLTYLGMGWVWSAWQS